MNIANTIRAGRHCVFNMHVHLSFVTKYRRNVLTKSLLDFMRTIFKDICKRFDAELIEFDGEGDHVHLQVSLSTKDCYF